MQRNILKKKNKKMLTAQANNAARASATRAEMPTEVAGRKAGTVQEDTMHMAIKQLTRPLAKKTQQILLDAQGYILESSDTIFSTDQLRHRPATEWSMFLCSIYDQILTMRLDSREIRFPHVETIADFVQGELFDCSFVRVELGDNDQIFVWSIFDYPKNALNFIQEQQQKRNKLY